MKKRARRSKKPDGSKEHTMSSEELVTKNSEIEQGVALLKEWGPEHTLYNTVLDGVRSAAEEITEKLASYGSLVEKAQKATEGARKTSTGMLGMKVIPASIAGLAAQLVARGRRPHSCPHCQCPPKGGVAIDVERTKKAGEEGAPVLKEFPIPVMALVAEGLSGNPFEAKKGGGGGGGGGGGTRGVAVLEEMGVGTKVIGEYPKGTEHRGEIVQTEAGVRFRITASPKAGLAGKEYASLSVSAGAITGSSTNGKVFWHEVAEAAKPETEKPQAEAKEAAA